MRSAEVWFELYGQSHTHPINKAIHWVCIPLITGTTLGLLQAIPLGTGPILHLGTAAALLALGFYVRLSPTLAAGMAVVASCCLAINAALASAGILLGTSVAVFALAWVAQFIGHTIEGQKPSFVTDLQFLLIGPAWLMGALYRRAGVQI